MKIDYLFLLARHQVVVAMLLVASFAAVAWYFAATRYEGGSLVDIDQVSPQSAKFQVDLNSAQWPELAVLPGIGEKLAQSIVEHRAKIGSFRNHEQIMDIQGIGEAKFADLKAHLLPMKESK